MEQRGRIIGSVKFAELKSDKNNSQFVNFTLSLGDNNGLAFLVAYSSDTIADFLSGKFTPDTVVAATGNYFERESMRYGVSTIKKSIITDKVEIMANDSKLGIRVITQADKNAEEEYEWMMRNEREAQRNAYVKAYGAAYFALYRDFKEEFWLKSGFPALSWEYDPERDLKEQALEAMDRCYGRLLSQEEMESIREQYHREWADLDMKKNVLQMELEESGMTQEEMTEYLQNYEQGMYINSIGQLNISTIKREANEQEAV